MTGGPRVRLRGIAAALCAFAMGCNLDEPEKLPAANVGLHAHASRLRAGEGTEVLVQAVDRDGNPIDGAHVALVTTDARRIVLAPTGTPTAATAKITTASVVLDGVRVAGAARLTLRAPADATSGTANVIAFLGAAPTDAEGQPPTAALEIEIVGDADAGTDASEASDASDAGGDS